MKGRKLFVFLLLFLSFTTGRMAFQPAGSDKLYSEKLRKLEGKITIIEKDYVIIDLGWNDGITPGMVFKVVGKDNSFIDRLEVKEVLGNNLSITNLFDRDRRARRGGRRKTVEVGHFVELEMGNPGPDQTEEIDIQIKRLKGRDTQTRMNAMDILAKIGDLDVLSEIFLILNENWNPKIISKAEQDFKLNLRRSAAWALGEIPFRVFSQTFLESKKETTLDKENEEILNNVIVVLLKLFYDSDRNVRLDAVRNITRLIAIRQIFSLETDSLFEPLGEILMEEKDSYVKRAVIDALAELKDVRTVSILLPAWDDKDPTVRANVNWALEKIGLPVVPILKEIINDPNEERKKEAVRVLYKLGYKIKKNGDKYEIAE